MKRTATILCLTLGLLALLDFGVGQVLGWAERSGRLGSLVQYFEYGRSVPGKLARWQDRPGTPGNLMDVAWRPEMIARSAVEFEAEASTAQPVIRGYGMSFVNNILQSAATQDPGLILDLHSGPAAPPNFTYALFEEDRDNRRAGDVAVLGILSSSVPAMGALSNSTWMFEQPAPFTYPVYYPKENGLRRVEPLVSSQDSFHALRLDPALVVGAAPSVQSFVHVLYQYRDALHWRPSHAHGRRRSTRRPDCRHRLDHARRTCA